MRSVRLFVADKVDESTERAISHGLDRFNEAQVGADPSRLAWVVARNEAGSVIGGLKGVSIWTWFMIDWLWVDENVRGRGIGSALIESAEDVARARGCEQAYLYTFSFQAPDFYHKLGYQEFARLDDFPPGHQRHWMRKKLVA